MRAGRQAPALRHWTCVRQVWAVRFALTRQRKSWLYRPSIKEVGSEQVICGSCFRLARYSGSTQFSRIRRYKQIKVVRNALTHARVSRHFTLPRQRLQIQVKNDRLDVPSVIDYAKDVGTTHVSTLLAILPGL